MKKKNDGNYAPIEPRNNSDYKKTSLYFTKVLCEDRNCPKSGAHEHYCKINILRLGGEFL